MEASEIPPYLDNTNGFITHVTETLGVLTGINQVLLDVGDDLVDRALSPGDERLGETAGTLDALIADAPALGAAHDLRLRELKQAASELEVEANDPAADGVLALVTGRSTTALNLREGLLLLKQKLPVHDTLASRMEPPSLSPQELGLVSEHRLNRDKLGLLTENLLLSVIKLVDCLSALVPALQRTTDPTVLVETFGDHLPFALLPVRVETRFMTIKHVRNNKLFVMVDEAFRSDTDVTATAEIDRAEDLQYESSPPVTGDLAPPATGMIADKHELWVRIYPDDIAIQTHEPLLAQDEIDAGKNFWVAVWRAGNNSNDELGAWRALAASYDPRRAAWIRKQTTPTNPGDKPASPVPEPAPLPIPPQFPALTPRPSSWTTQPHTSVLPGRFVVRVYSNNTYREVQGLPVPSPLPVGFSSSTDYSNYLNQHNAAINMPPELRWLTDFEEAEKVGMGIRIPLQGNEKIDGFDRLLVLGLKLDLDPGGGVQLLEELFDNHHYRTGMAIVPQGTPTNNTDERPSGYTSYEPGKEESFAVECGGPLFTTVTDHFLKSDGQRLAEALGVPAALFQHVANSNSFDGKESIAMNRALWSSTLGYYMKHLLSPAVVPENVAAMRPFFTNYVHGRGLIPAFRTGRQPYGVLPATVHSRWKYDNPYAFEAILHKKVLKPLNQFWETTFSPQVKHISGTSADPNGLLSDILGLHPASLSFYQRMTCGAYTMWNLHAFVLSGNFPSGQFAIIDTALPGMLDNEYRNNIQISYPSAPRILEMMFAYENRLLDGPVIDLLKLSETRTVQNIANGTANYIQWLEQSTLQQIRQEDFTNIGAPAGQAPPQALLYLLLRHAWFLEHVEASHCLLQRSGIVTADSSYNHELISITRGPGGEPTVSQEQRDRLLGVVNAEVKYENELNIQAIMQDLENNPEYQGSGMTPEQFETYLRDNSAEQVDIDTQERYGLRLEAYSVEQAQWDYLLQSFPPVSGTETMEQYIHGLLQSNDSCVQQLKEVKSALTLLKTLPTARLERCLAEHLDTCAYRLDAWMNSLVLKRLGEQRAANAQGIYLGAYSILERVKPGDFPGIHVVNVSLDTDGNTWETVVAQTGALKELSSTVPGNSPTSPEGQYWASIAPQYQQTTFIYLGEDESTELIEDRRTGKISAPPRVNPGNEGYILAPSLAHATTAAILRAGYVAHSETSSPDDALAVNLSSARVRKALFYIEGIRNGQTLGALLGYRFERALHDASLGQYIYDIREEYPLVAGSVVETPPGTANADAQANNVTDGLLLIEAYRQTTAPFWDDNLGSIPAGDRTLIAAEIDRVRDDMDAVGDLLLSEAVFQVARGNSSRAAAVLNAMGQATSIPEPEIVKTPRPGNALTHRCVVQLSPAASSQTTWTGTGRRALTEPALNNWLSIQLPGPANIRIHVTYIDPNTTQAVSTTISLDDLALQPLDLLAMFNAPGSDKREDASELSKRITYYVRQNFSASDASAVNIDYRNRTGMASADRTIFELRPVLLGLVQVTGNCRALLPEDFLLPGEAADVIAANQSAGLSSATLLTRITQAVNATTAPVGLSGAVNTLTSAITAAQQLAYTPDPPAGAANTLGQLRNAMMTASLFGIESAIPATATSFLLQDRDALVAQATKALAVLTGRHTNAAARLGNVSSLNGEAAKVKELTEIAKIVFHPSFKVFPDFTLYNATTVASSLADTLLLDEAGPFGVDEWMHGISRVRGRMGDYRKLMLLSETVTGRAFTTQRVAQLPFAGAGNNRWLGMQLPPGYEIPGDTLSLVIEANDAGAQPPTCGFVVDEWTEQVPSENVTTGIAMHFDQPGNEAPQCILLAVTPEITGSWSWNDLMDTLNETAAMAVRRAVEPDMIQDTSLSQVLPALVTPVTGETNTSPSLDFARNIIVSSPGASGPIDVSTSEHHSYDPTDLSTG